MPVIDSTYSQAAAEGRLVAQRCPLCGTLRLPPVGVCPKCLSQNDEWVELSGRGVVWSWIRMHRQYFNDERRTPPYNVVMVELEEGLRLISALDDDTGLAVGRPVEVVSRDSALGQLPWFRFARREG